MNTVEPATYALYINNLCTGNEAKVLYSILFLGANTKENTDYLVKMSGLSKNHFYTIRKQLFDKGILEKVGENYFTDIYILSDIYKEKFGC